MSRYSVVMVVLLAMVSACSRRPSKVLSEKEMTSLLVDIYKGEGIIEMQRGQYYTDSMKQKIKRSVYIKHGVTDEQVDSSYSWYGRHIEDYIKIQDDVIAKLEHELEDIAGHKITFAEGDSIDMWPYESRLRFSGSMPAHNIAFEIPLGDDSRNGDNYELSLKTVGAVTSGDFSAAIFAAYNDGTIEYRYVVVPNSDSMTRIRLVTDSANVLNSIYGYVYIDVAGERPVYIDSVSLVRTRLQPSNYTLRHSQRKLRKIMPEE